MNLKTGRGVPLNKTKGRRPQFHFLFESKGGNSRFFRNFNRNQPSGKNVFIIHERISFCLFWGAFVGLFCGSICFYSNLIVCNTLFSGPLCACGACERADVYPMSVSVWLFLWFCTLPWAQLDLAVFVGQWQWEKSSPGTQSTVSADLDASLSLEGKVSSKKTPRGWGGIGAEDGYLTGEQEEIKHCRISCLHSTMCQCC